MASILRSGLGKGFRPGGTSDGSLAVYCLEWVREKSRPVGYGVMGAEESSATLSGEHASRPTQTVPYGTGRSLTAFQAINCQATIIPSLRDNKLFRHPSTFFDSTSPAQIEDDDEDEDD